MYPVDFSLTHVARRQVVNQLSNMLAERDCNKRAGKDATTGMLATNISKGALGCLLIALDRNGMRKERHEGPFGNTSIPRSPPLAMQHAVAWICVDHRPRMRSWAARKGTDSAVYGGHAADGQRTLMVDETSAIGGAIPAAKPAAASPIACGGTRDVGLHIMETIRSSPIPPSKEVHYDT